MGSSFTDIAIDAPEPFSSRLFNGLLGDGRLRALQCAPRVVSALGGVAWGHSLH
jgi:hypothetical protein